MGIPRYILPKDLPDALSQLDDEELARLLAAALAETKRRDRASPQEVKSSRLSGKDISVPRGKINAVRAAAKAGLSASSIARQFGISLAQIRKITAMADK
jgi:DNA invertase Pin-like site-specific DNA recombinase